MSVAIGSDVMGWERKESIIAFLLQRGECVMDVGTIDPKQPVNHIEAAENVARLIQQGCCSFGVLLCRTGAGISVAANKLRGIRCVLCESCWTAYSARRINNANVLALGSAVVTDTMAQNMTKLFLETPFADQESAVRRVCLEQQLLDMQEFERKQFRK